MNIDVIKENAKTTKQFVQKYANVLFFVGGFIFDSVTLVRIDSALDLVLQAFYLLSVTFLIIVKMRFDYGLWHPQGRMEKIWEYESEAIHFFYGGLLSAYVIFYFKSTTLSRSVFFLGLVVLLMFANEMPQIRRAGSEMRLGLYAFCLVSFFNYLLPVLIGRMGGLIFFVAWILSIAATYFLIRYLSRMTPDPKQFLWKFSWAPALIMVLIAVLYVEKLIPPVPLSMQYAGIFRGVEREGDQYKLRYEKPPWYKFWQKDNRDFSAREGDQIFCFTRVFAPRRFHHRIYIRWFKKDPVSKDWLALDRVPLEIKGGRDEGFRGYAIKSNYDPGKWRVDVETEDGRTLGGVTFTVNKDDSTAPREWRELLM